MQHIDGSAINHSVPARMKYLQDFLAFDPEIDGPLIQATKPVLAPIVHNVVDLVYAHLLKYDITAASFAPSQAKGQASVEVSDLHLEHPNIKFRKDFLTGYLVKLVSNSDWSPESKFWSYLDNVGKAHTGVSAEASGLSWRKGKPPLWVDYREMGLLLGWVEVAVTDIVLDVEGLDLKTKGNIIKALAKFWWIQNDLFSRHYVVDRTTEPESSSMVSLQNRMAVVLPLSLAMVWMVSRFVKGL